MNWGDLANKVIGLGAPILGGALGGPIGAAAGQVLAETLGVEKTPEAVNTALENPAVAEKLADAEVEWAKAVAAVGVEQVKQVNETMRAEVAALAATPDKWWGSWRTHLAWMLVAECPVWVGLIVWSIVTGRANDLVQLSGLIMTWWGARFGVLGVHVWTGSHERRVAITGSTDDGVLAKIAKALTKR